MQAKEYIDPEAGRVLLVKSAASRRVSIRVHPADGVKVIVPRSLSYDEGLRFFMLKRDWVIFHAQAGLGHRHHCEAEK